MVVHILLDLLERVLDNQQIEGDFTLYGVLKRRNKRKGYLHTNA